MTPSPYNIHTQMGSAPQPSPAPSAQRLFGVFTRRERWGLSWRGRLIVTLLILLCGWSFLSGIYPFLAITRGVDTDELVVEGWVHEFAIHAAVQEFRTGSYRRVFTTGGPVAGTGRYTNDYNTAASVGAGRLKAAGIPHHLVQMVPSRIMSQNRTYHSAIALRDWFREHHLSVRGINIVTEDVHARRTRLLFQEAFGDTLLVGIIAAPNPDYDAKHWWRHSEGVREIVGEGIAYVYAMFFWLPAHKLAWILE